MNEDTDQQKPTTIVISTPLDVLIMGWIDAKWKKTGSEKTRAAYRDTLAQFRTGLQRQGLDLDSQDDQALAHIALTAQAFSSFSARGRQVRPATINQRLAILSSFYEYAIRQGALKVNPIDRVERARVQQYGKSKALESSIVEQRLAAIDRASLQGKRDYALLAVLLDTGRRVSEVVALQTHNLELIAGHFAVTFEHCKGNEEMHDTLSFAATHALIDWLESYYGTDYMQESRPLWVVLAHDRRYHGKPLGGQSVADICFKRLGVSSVHVTRHSWAKGMDDLGVSAATIQERLGHKSLATTGRYLQRLRSGDNPYADKLAAHLGIR